MYIKQCICSSTCIGCLHSPIHFRAGSVLYNTRRKRKTRVDASEVFSSCSRLTFRIVVMITGNKNDDDDDDDHEHDDDGDRDGDE